MKTPCLILCVAFLSTFIASGQGYIYDQQSATTPFAGGASAPIQQDQPMGQSFTPTLSSIGFVQLEFVDGHMGNDLGATVFVNLWSGSISNGTLLASTDPVSMADGINRFVATFLFSTAVTLSPGTTYYLQPFVVQPGSDTLWGVVASQGFNYSGGTFYFNGSPDSNNNDLWFREGIVAVPEPASSLLILLGSGLFLFARHKRKRHSCT